MHEEKIAEYRAEAAACISRADLDQNTGSAMRWRKLAQEWLAMAENLEQREKPILGGN